MLEFILKMHCLLSLGLEHMFCFGGIGDTLEEDIEHMHLG